MHVSSKEMNTQCQQVIFFHNRDETHGEWTLWPFQFSSQTDIQHCKAVVVFKVTDS